MSWIAGLVAALALTVLVAGCGGDSAAGSESGPVLPPPNTPEVGSPQGRWELTQLAMDGPIALLPAGASVDATFAAARVSGHSGVNTYRGPYTSTTGGKLRIGPVASTRMAGPARDTAVERAYLTALESSRSFDSDGETLTLFSRAGVPLVVFRHA